MSVVDEIKDRVDIIDVVSETVKLRKAGKNYTGFCPFHANTRTPAFVIFPETGTWHCFGACNEGGDVFSFLMKRDGLDFSEALEVLAERAGVELQPRSQADEAQAETHGRLRLLLESAIAYYRNNLEQSGPGEKVKHYLLQRGLTEQALEAFSIGYAPESWDATQTFLLGRGYTQEELLGAGMVTARESGGTYDRYRNRIMIPIWDSRGRPVGFGARIVDPDDMPKFLNSPQTVLFDKGRLLYGLDKARKAIRREDQVIIVEGYMDVIGLHQYGFENVVSPMGTALSEAQLRILKRFSRNIVLAMDPDVAGDRATLRGLDVARETLDREADPVFNARGLLRYEGRLDADIRVVTLPDGLDPDEVVARDPDAWRRLVDDAQPIVNYVLNVLTADQNLDDAKVKADIARQVLPLIEDVRDSVEREAYRQLLARRLRVDERALMGRRPSSSQPSRIRSQQPAQDAQSLETMRFRRSDPALERFCLALLLQKPELLYRMDRQLQTLHMDRLSANDFTGSERREIFGVIQTALAQDEQEPEAFWRNHMDGNLLPIAEEMLAELGRVMDLVQLEFDEPKVLEDVSARFLELRQQTIDINLSQLKFLLEQAQSPDDPESRNQEQMQDYTKDLKQVTLLKAGIEQALARRHGSKSTPAMGRGW